MSFGSDRGAPDGFCDPLRGLVTALGPVRDLDPVADPGLKDDLLRFARHRSREDAVFAAWVLAAVRHGVGVEDGYVDTIGWLAWKTGSSRSELRRVVRLAELCELLPETARLWREGRITTTAVELIAAARVAGFDEELVAIEGEFLALARRGDHKSLRMLTTHFRNCAWADGSKPDQPDGVTVADVGDRGVLRGDFAKPGLQTVRDALETFTRPPTADDESTLAQRQAEGLIRICEIALRRGTDAEGARPVVSYLTQEHTDETHPMMMGVFSGVIDPRERERILCDAMIVPVTTDRWGQILDQGTRDQRLEPATRRPSRRGVRTVSGRDVRPPLPGAMRTTSSTGNTAVGPASPTACICVDDTTCSCTNTATGTSRSTINSSACTEPTAPKSTPTPGPPCTGPSDAHSR